MKLELKRTRFFPTHTIGQLYIDGEFFCFTLEDVVRERVGVPVEKWKVKGESAIPVGKYPVSLQNSPRFGPDTITIHNVPGFTGIRIHGGNTHRDTEGCPLVGFALTDDLKMIKPGSSRLAVVELKKRIRESPDPVHIVVTGLPSK